MEQDLPLLVLLMIAAIVVLGASAALSWAFNWTLRRQVGERVRELAASREEQEQRADELNTLYQIAVALASTLDRGRIVDLVRQELQRRVPSTSMYIALGDERGGRTGFDIYWSAGQDLGLRLHEASEDALTSWLTASKMSLLVKDSEVLLTGAPVPATLTSAAPRSWLGIPLVVNARAAGAIVLVSDKPGTYDHDDVRLISTVGSQVAVALENARLYSDTHRLAITDGLTGLYNARFFYDALEREISRSARYERPFCVLIVDVDDFKLFNDAHGHLAGDDLLREVAGALTGGTRRSDVVARYGGEEFAAILVETDSDAAMQLAERIRQAIAGRVFKVAGMDRGARVSVSAGVSTFPRHGTTARDLVQAADRALYAAKRAGKNRVTLSTGLAEAAEAVGPLSEAR